MQHSREPAWMFCHPKARASEGSRVTLQTFVSVKRWQ
jgi:hypothetical protein